MERLIGPYSHIGLNDQVVYLGADVVRLEPSTPRLCGARFGRLPQVSVRKSAGLVLLVLGACNQLATTDTSGRTAVNTQTDVLTFELDVPAHIVHGATVPFTLTLTNMSNRPVEVTLGGRPPYDVVVTAADNAVVWRWSAGKATQMILETRTLRPGEELEYTVEWDGRTDRGDRVPPGAYHARGILKLDPPDMMTTAPTRFELRAP